MLWAEERPVAPFACWAGWENEMVLKLAVFVTESLDAEGNTKKNLYSTCEESDPVSNLKLPKNASSITMPKYFHPYQDERPTLNLEKQCGFTYQMN